MAKRILDREQIVKLYKSGLSMNAIGKKLGHHHGVIAYHIHHSGIPIRNPKYRYSKIKTEDVVRLYKEGFSTCEIAESVGLTPQTISERLWKNGIKPRSKGEAQKLAYKRGRLKYTTGKDNPNWKGGRYITKRGYIEIRVNKKQIPEHRYVWEQYHSKLEKGWIVHHLNGKRDDNRIENLSAMPRKRHSPTLIVRAHQKRILKLEFEIGKLKGAITKK